MKASPQRVGGEVYNLAQWAKQLGSSPCLYQHALRSSLSPSLCLKARLLGTPRDTGNLLAFKISGEGGLCSSFASTCTCQTVCKYVSEMITKPEHFLVIQKFHAGPVPLFLSCHSSNLYLRPAPTEDPRSKNLIHRDRFSCG